MSCVTPQASENEPATSVCEIGQELLQADTNQRILAIGLRPQADRDSILTIVAPFGLRLSEGVNIEVAEELVANVPFQTCLPGGCVATTSLEQSGVDRLAAGAEAQITMLTNTEQPMSVTISLSGFTAAWNRLLEF